MRLRREEGTDKKAAENKRKNVRGGRHCNVTIGLKLRKGKVVLVDAVWPYRGSRGTASLIFIYYMVHAPAALLLQTTRYQLIGPQSSSGCFGKEKKLFPLKSVVLNLTLAYIFFVLKSLFHCCVWSVEWWDACKWWTEQEYGRERFSLSD